MRMFIFGIAFVLYVLRLSGSNGFCQKTYQENSNFMVGCDMCFKWYHTKCIDFDDSLADIADFFHCAGCI